MKLTIYKHEKHGLIAIFKPYNSKLITCIWTSKKLETGTAWTIGEQYIPFPKNYDCIDTITINEKEVQITRNMVNPKLTKKEIELAEQIAVESEL